MRRGRQPDVPTLTQMYRRLLRVFGPQHWWPARHPFEVMVGAILTQATAWHNVERAIDNLRSTKVLSAERLSSIGRRRLERLIRPAGYFRQKAARLRALSRWAVARFQGRPSRMFRVEHNALRTELLTIPGVGEETADSILLYAGQQPVFVIDAYTRRIFGRHYLIDGHEPYEQLQTFVMDQLPTDPQLFNEFHALLVELGKRHCRRRAPDCDHCPLAEFPHNPEDMTHG
ncbi:MAG: endonuclease III domain-containing protein [Candidatus Omnitrophica bacterium]|nr:endonuclease III domain-containing protein [Candidatus Omnitrophota bacterium]